MEGLNSLAALALIAFVVFLVILFLKEFGGAIAKLGAGLVIGAIGYVVVLGCAGWAFQAGYGALGLAVLVFGIIGLRIIFSEM